MDDQGLDLYVHASSAKGEVLLLDLRDKQGRALPPFSPGAHIEVRLADDLVRQYSLCGDPRDCYSYKIAVLRIPGGSGSNSVHKELRCGSPVRTSHPRNCFPLEHSPRYLFIAGGIGITPLLPMITMVVEADSAWELHYCIKDVASNPFLDHLLQYGGERVKIYESCRGNKLSVPDLLSQLSNPALTLVYTCGPQGLMNDVRAYATGLLAQRVRYESFMASADTDSPSVEAVEIVCAKSGKTFLWPPDRSLLSMLDEHRIRVRRSCRQGMCGACEVRVLEGTPDHRDSLRTSPERAADGLMRACVSRSKSKRLILDL